MNDIYSEPLQDAVQWMGRALLAEQAVKNLQEEIAECDQLRTRLSNILRGVAVALKGPEDHLTSHSWHDLAELTVCTKLDADRFQACRVEARGWPEEGGEAALVLAVDQFRKERGL
jgi:hypothetical protein